MEVTEKQLETFYRKIVDRFDAIGLLGIKFEIDDDNTLIITEQIRCYDWMADELFSVYEDRDYITKISPEGEAI